MSRIKNFFDNGLVENKIEGFPYPQKFCRHCEHEMSPERAIHIQDEPLHFKTLYICYNPKCPAYDYPARQAHALVYYSTDEAFRALELHRILYYRKTK